MIKLIFLEQEEVNVIRVGYDVFTKIRLAMIKYERKKCYSRTIFTTPATTGAICVRCRRGFFNGKHVYEKDAQRFFDAVNRRRK